MASETEKQAEFLRKLTDETKAKRDITIPRFGGREPTQRIHEADARLGFGAAIVLAFGALLYYEAHGCYAMGFCKDIHDVRDTFEGFAFAIFTALGAIVGFFFAERR